MRCEASDAAKANRWSRFRGWATTSSDGAAAEVPSIAARGAFASPAIASGISTSGWSCTCRWRTVAMGAARPDSQAWARASAVSVLTAPSRPAYASGQRLGP
jgi:hypothetical protein